MVTMRFSSLFILFLLPAISAAETIDVAVASNLTQPIKKIVAAYEARSSSRVRLTFGASGNLARQIVQGAPFQLFISADRSYIDFLLEQQIVNYPGMEFTRGSIGIFIPNDSILRSETDLKSVINAMMYRSYRRIAIANPEHAPYGAAALQALQNAGLWAIEQNRLIKADNVAQLVRYSLSGSVDAAIIPASFMEQGNMAGEGKFFRFPESWHMPVIQYLLVLENAGSQARDFAAFLYSDIAGSILSEYGYILLQS